MTEVKRRRPVAQTFLLDLLAEQLDGLALGDQRSLDIVDVGGGTGGVAIWLAARGHRVTVVDPSPDALASLDRRAAEAGHTDRIQGRQGDAADLVELLGAQAADVLICHRVLEVVESRPLALAAMAEVLRPGGVLSLLVAQRHALVLSQVLTGHIQAARRAWADPVHLDQAQVFALLEEARFSILAAHGIGAAADHVPAALLETDAASYDALLALEADVSRDPAFRALAPQLHVFAQISAGHHPGR